MDFISKIVHKHLLNEVKVKSSDRVKLYEDDKLLVVVPLTHQASCKYGSNTPWCVAVVGNNEHYSDYTSNGVLIYYIIKSSYGDNKKKEYKLCYYHSYTEEFEEYQGWYDMSDYQFGKDEDGPDINLIKFLIPDKVKSIVDDYIKNHKSIFLKKQSDTRKQLGDIILNDKDNIIIVNDNDYIVFDRETPVGNNPDFLKIMGWNPTNSNEHNIAIYFYKKSNGNLFFINLPFQMEVFNLSDSKLSHHTAHNAFTYNEIDRKSLISKYEKIIVNYFYNKRKKYFNGHSIYIHPERVQIGDFYPLSTYNREIIDIDKSTTPYTIYSFDKDNNRKTTLYYNTDYGIPVVYNKERHDKLI